MKNIVCILCLSASLVTLASAYTTSNPTTQYPSRSISTGAARDGFFVHDHKIFMVHNGVTTQVKHEILFPNGLRVQANTTVTLRNGHEVKLLPQQWLNFSGTIEDQIVQAAPQRPVVVHEKGVRESGVSARDGITVSGADIFITRNGATEKITSEMRLSNGVIVHPNGTITLANGKKITLRAEQLLDFHGVVHEAPARPSR